MKRDRNTFFGETTMSQSGYYPNQMNPGVMPAPYQQSSASQNFYAGPYPNNNMNINTDIDSRFSKIERQINRLETRISKLENSANSYNSEIIEENISNSNMYMI